MDGEETKLGRTASLGRCPGPMPCPQSCSIQGQLSVASSILGMALSSPRGNLFFFLDVHFGVLLPG